MNKDIELIEEHIESSEYFEAVKLLKILKNAKTEKNTKPYISLCLGFCYFELFKYKQSFYYYVESFKDLASKHAIYAIATLYFFGEGTKKDVDKAIFLYRDLYSDNCMVSSYNLGLIHVGLKKYKRAMVYFRKACKHGHLGAFKHFYKVAYHEGKYTKLKSTVLIIFIHLKIYLLKLFKSKILKQYDSRLNNGIGKNRDSIRINPYPLGKFSEEISILKPPTQANKPDKP